MSFFVFASPGALAAASEGLTGIGSTIQTANSAAAVATTQVVAPAHDGVSAAVATAFGSYAEEYQALSAQMALFHEQFAQTLASGSAMYAAAEAANASPLQTLQ
jgi:PE family protein